MNAMNRRRYDMLVRVRAFCVDHPDIFGSTPFGTEMFAALDRSVTEVSESFAMQSSGIAVGHGATTSRDESRAALRHSLESIHRSSRFLGLETAGVEDHFPMPRRASDRELVADAKAVIHAATPLTDAFVRHGLPPDVLPELPARILALEQAMLAQTAGKESHVGAKAAVSAALRSGVTAVDALESILLSGPRPDSETLAIWRNVRRVGPARPKQAAAVAPAETAQPVTPSAPTSEPALPSEAA